MIPRETVDLILETARIEEVVSDFVTLKRRGSSYVACCPFHNEKTPSFHVTPSRGMFKCFGCGKAGSAVGFVMEYEHLSYVEALRYLARKYNIEIVEKEETAEEIAARKHNESLLLVSEFAAKFFKDSLSTEEGHAIGYRYFASRGLTDETIAKYGLGWAPKSKSALTSAARAEGYKDEYLEETGLCSKWEDGSLHDRFYDRVVFPIHSVSGRVIAFGGRTLLKEKSETVAKYVNSKESEIYVKSKSLYGIYFAKNEIAKARRCYLVEGYLDVLSMHQLGITNTVASSGTSLTPEQVKLIKRFTEDVTVIYDGDNAGLNAAVRAISLILREGMNPRVVFLPDGDDPDSFSRKHTLEEVKDFIGSHEQDGIDFKTSLLLGDAGDDPLKKAGVINEIADTIAEIPDAIKRAMYVESCSARFGIGSDILFDRITSTRGKNAVKEHPRSARQDNPAPPVPAAAESRPSPAPQQGQSGASQLVFEDPILAPCEQELLYFIIVYGCSPLEFESDSEFYSPDEPQTVAEFIDEAVNPSSTPFVNTVYRNVYDMYFKAYDEGKTQEQIVRSLLDSEDRTVAYVTGQLAEEKYQLSVKQYVESLTTVSSKLANFVPRSILVYQDKKLQSRIAALTRSLSASPDNAVEIMQEIDRLNRVKKRIRIRLGREKQD